MTIADVNHKGAANGQDSEVRRRRFFAALDAERQARRCTWKQVAEECGISASTLSRMSQGKHPDVNGLAALAAWSGLDVDRFVRSAAAKHEPEPSR